MTNPVHVQVRKQYSTKKGSTGELLHQETADREILEEDEKRRRLLMILFGLGTNTGLKRIASSTNNPVSFDNLRYLKRKYINKDNLRNANIAVVNAIHKARQSYLGRKNNQLRI